MTDHPITKVHVAGRDVEISSALGKVNLDNLRQELENAGEMAIWYGILSARAKFRANQAQNFVDLTYARLDRQKREYNPPGAKLYEKDIESQIKLEPDYQSAIQELYTAQEAADIVEGVKYALVRKQSTLEALAPLITQEVQSQDTKIYDRIPRLPSPRKD